MRVLITGSAGVVGQNLVGRLNQRFTLRGFDNRETPGLADAPVGDIADFDAVSEAVRDMEAVIHLAGFGGEREWERMLPTNYVGTYNVFEACRQNGVKRVAFASRAGLLSSYPQEQHRTIDLPPLPRSTYDISKVFGESFGYMYAHRHDMEVVSVRIGNFSGERDLPEHPHHLSHGDAALVFERAITHPGVKYEAVFGVSDSNWPLYDLDHGRRAIGYEPQDFADVPENERQ
jgi:uronate dehydrogenase